MRPELRYYRYVLGMNVNDEDIWERKFFELINDPNGPLHDDERDCIKMKCGNEYTYKEIGEALGYGEHGEQKARMLALRARRKMAQHYKEYIVPEIIKSLKEDSK